MCKLLTLAWCCRLSLLHSFIFDINDEFTCSGFTEEELDEINKENTKDLPDLEPELLDFIYTFAKVRGALEKVLCFNMVRVIGLRNSLQKSTAEIREELNQPHARLGKAYDPTVDYVYDHIKSTVADWWVHGGKSRCCRSGFLMDELLRYRVRLLEKTPNPLALNMPEQWYRTNLWRSIDNAFGDIPYVFVVGWVFFFFDFKLFSHRCCILSLLYALRPSAESAPGSRQRNGKTGTESSGTRHRCRGSRLVKRETGLFDR